MSWEDILKNPPPLDANDEQEIQDLIRFRNYTRQEAEDVVRRKRGKRGKVRRATYDDYMRSYKSDIESKILSEIEKEGGALGMKNLKQFGEESEIKSPIQIGKEGRFSCTKTEIFTPTNRSDTEWMNVLKKDKKDMQGVVYMILIERARK